MLNKITYPIRLSLFYFISHSALAQDICQTALEKIYEKNSDLIAVIKINTDKKGLYLSTVETSKDCEIYQPFLFVNDPDVIKSDNGLCIILPAGEIQLGLCGLRVRLCPTEKDCQTVDINLKTKAGRYLAAQPAYYEMTFP